MSTRKTKTAAQRAAEALEPVARKVAKLEAALEHQRSLVQNYEGQLAYAKGRRDYLANDPDLLIADRNRILGDEIPVDDAELEEPAETGRHTTTERNHDDV